MKKTLLAIALFALVACKSDPVAQLVADYEQTVFDSKLDLDFKMLDQKLIKEHTTADSIKVLEEFLNEVRKNQITELEGLITNMRTEIETTEFQEVIDQFTVKIEEYTQEIEAFKKNEKQTYLMKEIQKDIDRFNAMEDPLFGYIYECRYSIKNPMLNNVTQELTGTYLVNPSKSAILKKVDTEKD